MKRTSRQVGPVDKPTAWRSNVVKYANACSRKGKTASFKEHTEMILFLEQHDLLTMSKFRAKLDEVETSMDGIKARMDVFTARVRRLWSSKSGRTSWLAFSRSAATCTWNLHPSRNS